MVEIYKILEFTMLIMRKFYFPIFCCMAIFIYVMQLGGIALPDFWDDYVNDFLCMPIVLYLCRFTVRTIRSSSKLQLPLPLIFLLTVAYSLFFEYYQPIVDSRYTQDLLDVVLYFSGSLFFYLVEEGIWGSKERTGQFREYFNRTN